MELWKSQYVFYEVVGSKLPSKNKFITSIMYLFGENKEADSYIFLVPRSDSFSVVEEFF